MILSPTPPTRIGLLAVWELIIFRARSDEICTSQIILYPPNTHAVTGHEVACAVCPVCACANANSRVWRQTPPGGKCVRNSRARSCLCLEGEQVGRRPFMPTSERSAEASRMVCACMLSLSTPPNVSACSEGSCRPLAGRRAKWRLFLGQKVFSCGDGNDIIPTCAWANAARSHGWPFMPTRRPTPSLSAPPNTPMRSERSCQRRLQTVCR
jgi:hypothetical protein